MEEHKRDAARDGLLLSTFELCCYYVVRYEVAIFASSSCIRRQTPKNVVRSGTFLVFVCEKWKKDRLRLIVYLSRNSELALLLEPILSVHDRKMRTGAKILR
jgi:hypothetical protein